MGPIHVKFTLNSNGHLTPVQEGYRLWTHHDIHKSRFMADEKDPLVLSSYIFELLEENPGLAGFLIQLHMEDVEAVVESVTAHAEKGAETKTTLYVGREEEEDVEEEVEEVEEVGGGRRLMAVQRMVRVLLGDPTIVCGTSTKGEVCLSGGFCTALCAPLFMAILHSQLRSMRP